MNMAIKFQFLQKQKNNIAIMHTRASEMFLFVTYIFKQLFLMELCIVSCQKKKKMCIVTFLT